MSHDRENINRSQGKMRVNLKFSVQWHITNRCSQRCKHCYLFQKEKGNCNSEQELNIETMAIIAEDIFTTAKTLKADAFFVLTGGDPLLYPKFWDFLDIISLLSSKLQVKYVVDILGNPFFITAQIVSKLRVHGIRKFQLSLDGLEEKHDFLRSRGGFSKTFQAMHILKEAGIRTTCMSTLSKFNSPDLIGLMRKVAEEGFDAFAFARFCRPSGLSLEEYKKQMFTPLEYKELLTQVDNIHQELAISYPGTRFVQKDHLWELFLYEKDMEKQSAELKTINKRKVVMSGCSLGITGPSILSDGTVYACRRFNSPIGKVPDQKLIDLFIDSSKLNCYRDLTKYKKCKKCPLLYICRGCGAVAYGYSGTFFDPDPQCWRNVA